MVKNNNKIIKKRQHQSSDEESNYSDSGDEKIVAKHINKKQVVVNKKHSEEDEDNVKSNNINNNKPLATISMPSGGNQNKKITDILTELSIFEKNKGLVHKFTAYRKAVQSIKAYPKEIKSGIEAQKLDGVGKKIAKKIDEILANGQLKKLNCQQKDEELTSIGEISKVSGIGPKAAQKFYDEGIKSIKDLEKIKDKLTHHQQIGLKYFNEIEQRIPRHEIEQFEKLVGDALLKIDKKIIYQTCGSYRRGAESSGDIDILISHPDYTLKMKDNKETFHIIEKLVDSLKKQKIIIDDLSLGPLKYMGICTLANINNNNSNDKNKKEEKEKNKYSDDDDDDDNETDDCTIKEISENEDNTSDDDDGEEFNDDSDTEPEDNSKKLPPPKKEVIKKPTKQTTNTTTTTTTSTKNSNNTITNTNTNTKPIARRIDFKLTPIESYPYALLHSTGSDEFNRQCRLLALKNGYTLSEYSINKVEKETGKVEKPILLNSEKDIFNLIGLKYHSPKDRNI